MKIIWALKRLKIEGTVAINFGSYTKTVYASLTVFSQTTDVQNYTRLNTSEFFFRNWKLFAVTFIFEDNLFHFRF